MVDLYLNIILLKNVILVANLVTILSIFKVKDVEKFSCPLFCHLIFSGPIYLTKRQLSALLHFIGKYRLLTVLLC